MFFKKPTKHINYLVEKYIDVYYDIDKKTGIVRWKEFANLSQYKKAVDAQLQMVFEESVEYLICDVRKFKGTTQEGEEYTIKEILPKLYHQSDLKKIAYIKGSNAFSNFSVNQIKKDVDDESYILTKNFSTLEEAIQWVKESTETA